MDENNLSKADFHRRSELETSTKFVSKIDAEFGSIIVVQSVSTGQRYMLKEKHFTERFRFLEELNRTKSRHQLTHANILKLVDYSTLTKIDKAEESYRIRLFFEYFPSNLTRELKNRVANKSDFTLEEITYLVYDAISACAFLQRHNINHGDLTPDVIMRTDDGHFVLGDKLRTKTAFPQSLIDRYIRGERLFLSPEMFAMIRSRDSEAINRMDYFVNDVFILGLCILEAGTKADVSQLFKRSASSIDKDRLAELVNAFGKRYGTDSLPHLVLTKMLEFNPKKRPDFAVLKAALPPYQDVIVFFRGHAPAEPAPRMSRASNAEPAWGATSSLQTSMVETSDSKKKSIFGPERKQTIGSSSIGSYTVIQSERTPQDGIFLTGYQMKNQSLVLSQVQLSFTQSMPPSVNDSGFFKEVEHLGPLGSNSNLYRQQPPQAPSQQFGQSQNHSQLQNDAFRKQSVQGGPPPTSPNLLAKQSLIRPSNNPNMMPLGPLHHDVRQGPHESQIIQAQPGLPPQQMRQIAPPLPPRHPQSTLPINASPNIKPSQPRPPSHLQPPAQPGQPGYNPLMMATPKFKSSSFVDNSRIQHSATPDKTRHNTLAAPHAQPRINSSGNMDGKQMPKSSTQKGHFNIFQ